MILKALYDYYNRSRGTLPVYGRELKEIGFLLVIDCNGNFLRFEDCRNDDKKSAKVFLVKKHIGRSSALAANYLYDNSAYVFGYSDKDDARTRSEFITFKNKVEEIYNAHPDNKDITALHLFYKQERDVLVDKLQRDSLWPEIAKCLNKKYSTFSFRIDGDLEIVAEKEELLDSDEGEKEEDNAICLVKGGRGTPVETTTATMIPGSQATAKLVAFQVNSGYDSYGKTKGYNAPISKEAEFAYTTALNHMLSRDSRNKFQLGSRTYLFWASSADEAGRQMEESFFDLFGFNNEDDDPDRGIEKVRKVFESISSGQLKTTSDDRFYILGLAPNSARIAVVYWAEIPIREFAGTITRHFQDMEIVDTRNDKKPYTALRSILSAVTLGGKVADVTPNLPDALLKSIFQGLPYPQTLFASCIRRIRAESSEKDKCAIHIVRAAILKAYLNRLKDNQTIINVMLDKENTNQGYLCGRLFAVLDKIQEEANNQHSIRERYMNSASSTPAAVFSTILNLSSHHLENLKSEGRKIFFEQMKQEIISKIDADGFRAQLDLQDQGRFFIGYYHQRQEFFTKNDGENSIK